MILPSVDFEKQEKLGQVNKYLKKLFPIVTTFCSKSWGDQTFNDGVKLCGKGVQTS